MFDCLQSKEGVNHIFPLDKSEQNVLFIKTPANRQISIELTFRKDCMFPYTGTCLMWTFEFAWKFNAKNERYYFAQTGRITAGKLDSFSSLTVMWIRDNYQRFLHFDRKKALYCESAMVPLSVRSNKVFECCLNFSKFSLPFFQKQKYYIFIQNKNWIELNESRSLNYPSWIEASKLCLQFGGYLPYFTNRDELQEFLALIKFAENLNVTEALYIGLKWERKHNTPMVGLVFSYCSSGSFSSV